MGSTNFTPNYNLPQFIGTDKPAWLTDVNTAMSNIDTAIKNAADDASSAVSTAGSASSAAAGAVNSVNTLNTQINTPGTGLAAQVTSHGTAITNIGNTIGTTPLTTVAQTLTGAIEEVKNSIPAISGTVKLVNSGSVSEAYTGSNTVIQAMNSVYAALVTIFSGLATNEYIRITGGTAASGTVPDLFSPATGLIHTIPTGIPLERSSINNTRFLYFKATFGANSEMFNYGSDSGCYDYSSVTPASGFATINYERYKIES